MAEAPRIGVLASGGGSNLQALLDAHERGDLPASVVLVISNNSASGALARARAHQIPALHISGRTHADPDAAILAALHKHGVSLVVLAGYMKLLSRELVRGFEGRLLNIHPGPLPALGGKGMYGLNVHQAALERGLEHSGPTVHLVDERYDEGPILAHQPVPVMPGDTPESLADRVLGAEHDLLWRVIRDRFCS